MVWKNKFGFAVGEYVGVGGGAGDYVFKWSGGVNRVGLVVWWVGVELGLVRFTRVCGRGD